MNKTFKIEFDLNPASLNSIRDYFFLASFAQDAPKEHNEACAQIARALSSDRYSNHASERARYFERIIKDASSEAARAIYKEAQALCRSAR